MKPLVSVVTVAYNSEKTIAATIESVLEQTYPNVEYFIIDGKSKDKTVELAESYRNRFDKKGYIYHIVSEPDQGIYDAMNKGIRLATGDIIGLINSDDWYEPTAVEKTVQTMQRENCDITFGDIILHRSNGGIIRKRAKLGKIETSRYWNHPTMFVKADVYKAFPFPCIGIHDDYTAYLAMKKAGKKIVTIPHVLAHFKMGGTSNRRSLKMSLQRIKDRYSCYQYNGYSKWYLFECIIMEAAKFVLG
ncbi:MAG: glycosyltransferase [Lachnospiraceae bacterium]|nr:glycosyltransferase [Lachnospiraceae bacterium]